MGGSRKNTKKVIHTETGTRVKILKVTICEVKVCNRVNVKRFNVLVNCRVQFILFPQNLTFLNTFPVFLIRLDLLRSGDLLSTFFCKLHNFCTSTKLYFTILVNYIGIKKRYACEGVSIIFRLPSNIPTLNSYLM